MRFVQGFWASISNGKIDLSEKRDTQPYTLQHHPSGLGNDFSSSQIKTNYNGRDFLSVATPPMSKPNTPRNMLNQI